MTSKVLKSTSRGQITLPKKWRDHLKTDVYLAEIHENKLIIVPFDIKSRPKEEVIFDADRDNNGKGIDLDDLAKLIKKNRHG